MKKLLIVLGAITLFFSVIIVFIFYKKDVNKIYNNYDKIIEREDGIMDNKLYIKVNNNVMEANLLSNSSTKALVDKLESSDITIQMSDYSNFEKVGDLGFSLPTNDKMIDTDYGDIILYQGNTLSIYYDRNTWSLTRLGKININKDELKSILGSGDITVTLSLNK